ncbi:[NiFe]-hydrogenase assembly chaperone HybE [Ideonella livida]|uniref:[NiFe]-hydrogenase assembly chaperone HybE n=1 Tax=Ideonella livida TaxID=2707176 RepID=A0A7C9TJQ4_9BURK|nr:[NiFe]-hydrogenase assembly chaperone HybE [Ideonella livida]NDY89806.1 [NiFe]-hydrogenase assembly chaperone HybE [Ideonella livida]
MTPNSYPDALAPAQRLVHRLQVMEAHYRHIATTRMAGMPLLHPGLRVQALGFELQPAMVQENERLPWACGVLVTPWFMNLVRLPLLRQDAVAAVTAGWLAAGERAWRRLGGHELDFIGAFEGSGMAGELGALEVCSLFSPMQGFADHGAAVATGLEVLRQLRQAPMAGAAAPATPAATALPPPALPPVPARRGFLLGRSALGPQGSA